MLFGSGGPVGGPVEYLGGTCGGPVGGWPGARTRKVPRAGPGRTQEDPGGPGVALGRGRRSTRVGVISYLTGTRPQSLHLSTCLAFPQEPPSPLSNRHGLPADADRRRRYVPFFVPVFLSFPFTHWKPYLWYSGLLTFLQNWPARMHLCPHGNTACT